MILRPAQKDDVDLILHWRNDLKTRMASHSMAEINVADHRAWFESVLKNPARKLWIADHEGQSIGSVRADFCDDVWVLSWMMAEHARGKGLAKLMVAMFVAQIGEPVRAEIKKSNLASSCIAEYAGLQWQAETAEINVYYRGPLSALNQYKM